MGGVLRDGSVMPGMLFRLLVVALLLGRGAAISCYVCNSYNNYEDCSGLEKLPEERKSLYEVNCDHLGGGRTFTLCRKMVQRIGTETRVIRQCGTQGSLDCVRRTGTIDFKVQYCHCNDNFCNHALSVHAPALRCLWPAVGLLVWRMMAL